MVGLVDLYCKQTVLTEKYERILRLPGVGRSAPSHNGSRRSRHLSPTQAAEIIAAYHAGEPVEALAMRLQVHRATIGNVLDRAEVARRPRGLNDEQAEQAVGMYADGLSVAKIARHFNVAPSGVDRLLKRKGVVLRDRHWRKHHE